MLDLGRALDQRLELLRDGKTIAEEKRSACRNQGDAMRGRLSACAAHAGVARPRVAARRLPGEGGIASRMSLVLGEVLTAIVTPFDKDGAVDYDRFRALARHVIDSGADGLVVAATTGESPDADRRGEAPALGRGRRRGGGEGDRDRQHRHVLDRALRAPHRAGARARRRRLPRRHAVLQQAAAARDRRALQGDRRGQRQADHRLQHPAAGRRQHRAGDDARARRDPDRAGGQAGDRGARPGAAHRRRDRARRSTRAATTSSTRSSRSAASAASSSTATSSRGA